jgi:predicted dehydrogenase
MAAKVNVGIIGLGFMGTTHLDIYKANDKANVVAIADINPAKLAGDISSVFANIGGADNSIPLDLSGMALYDDGMDLINDPDVDLVDICVPTFLHRQYAIAALEAGKHVMLEKPIGRNSDDAKAIVEAAARTEQCFTVGMCVRAWPEYRYVYEQYKAGTYGKLVNAFFKRFSPNMAGKSWEDWFSDEGRSGGALLDLHLHDIDQVVSLFGRPKAVSSTGSKGFRSQKSVDHVFTFYDFEDGAMVVAEGGWSGGDNAPFEMSFQLVCEKATVIFNAAGLHEYFEDGTTVQPDLSAYPGPTGWHREIDNLLDAIQAGVPANQYLTPAEMIDGLCIAEAEQESVDNKSAKTVVAYK